MDEGAKAVNKEGKHKQSYRPILSLFLDGYAIMMLYFKEDVRGWKTMRNELLIAECAFGWGQMFQLYQYYLDVDGTRYPLSELTHISHTYHRVLGITSARIELRFGKKKVMLRGIAAIEDAQRAITYLTAHYLGLPQTNGTNWNSNSDEENSFPSGEQGVSDCTHQFITPLNKAQEKPFPSALPPETQAELEEYSPITTEDMLLQEHT